MEVERYYSDSKNILLAGTRKFIPEEISFGAVSDRSVFDTYYFSPLKPEWHEFRYRLFHYYSYNASILFYPWVIVFSCNRVAPKIWLEKVGGFEEGFKAWGVYDVETPLPRACSTLGYETCPRIRVLPGRILR